jgi:hypothetical protein
VRISSLRCLNEFFSQVNKQTGILRPDHGGALQGRLERLVKHLSSNATKNMTTRRKPESRTPVLAGLSLPALLARAGMDAVMWGQAGG